VLISVRKRMVNAQGANMESIRSKYKDDVDFAQLALQDPEFAKILKSNGQLDFSNPESVLQLTKSLLKRDFGLSVTLPSDRLCPPVPNRLNYLFWIQDLLDTTSDSYSDKYDPKRAVIGYDIGTGASCIYPLLGCVLRPKWRIVATEIDEMSFKYAEENVKANQLESRIKVLKPVIRAPLIPHFTDDNIEFCMCNPPFYECASEMLATAASKQRPPNSVCTGAEVEMVTPGGEVAFVSRMIHESIVLRSKIQWYTSMLGKFSSVATIVEKLKYHKITNYAVTEFVQGSKTRRWAIAWSFGDMRPAAGIARSLKSLPKHLLPFPSEYSFLLPESSKTVLQSTSLQLNSLLSDLPLQWKWVTTISTGVGFAEGNVWSRAARRRSIRSPSSADSSIDEDMEMALGFKITLQEKSDPGPGILVTARWLKGYDTVLFESFCGMLKRKLETRRD